MAYYFCQLPRTAALESSLLSRLSLVGLEIFEISSVTADPLGFENNLMSSRQTGLQDLLELDIKLKQPLRGPSAVGFV
jgi:hypothetical protein